MENDQRETRVFTLQQLEIREAGDQGPSIHGYAAVYDVLSENLGGFREVIRRGFFEPVMGDDVRALFNHNSDYVLGRSTTGTLTMEDDEKGLRVAIQPPDTQWANDLIVSMKRGDVDQMSFGFFVEKDNWKRDEDDRVIRELLLARRLLDVSVVTFPAYPQTSVEARSKAKELGGGNAQKAAGDAQAGGPAGDPEAARLQARRANQRRMDRLELVKRQGV